MPNLWTPIESISQLTQVLDEAQVNDNESILILKHSNRCAISSMAKKRLESNVSPLISYFVIDVIGDRAVSSSLAELVQVNHESPQAFLFKKGKLIGNWSHMDIRPSTILAEV